MQIPVSSILPVMTRVDDGEYGTVRYLGDGCRRPWPHTSSRKIYEGKNNNILYRVASYLPFHDDGRPAARGGGGGSECGDGGIQLLLADVTPGSGEVAENRDGNDVPAVV